MKINLPKIPRADLPRWTEWVEVLRGVAAILFIPCLCLYGSILVYLLWAFAKVGPLEVTLKVVDGLIWMLLGILVLIGLGTLWLQKRAIPDFKVNLPGGASVELDNHADEATIQINQEQ